MSVYIYGDFTSLLIMFPLLSNFFFCGNYLPLLYQSYYPYIEFHHLRLCYLPCLYQSYFPYHEFHLLILCYLPFFYQSYFPLHEIHLLRGCFLSCLYLSYFPFPELHLFQVCVSAWGLKLIGQDFWVLHVFQDMK